MDVRNIRNVVMKVFSLIIEASSRRIESILTMRQSY